MRTHPPALLTLAKRTLVDERLIPSGSSGGGPARILVAVSGGPDSMALLHILARLRTTLAYELFAHGIDHGLRGEAEGELDRAQAFAQKLEISWGRTRVDVAPGGNLQARARARRFQALHEAATKAGATRIATGHHADDRAETVLLRLLRGASPSGLAVLPPRQGALIRPFIRARRGDIAAHVGRHDIPFAADPSNLDPRFLRSRVRHEVLPLLESLSPGIVAHLNGLADDLASKDLDAYEQTYVPPLPRSARLALAALAASRSRTGRVMLPHGLVVSFEPSNAKE